jgi:hypothetical protein
MAALPSVRLAAAGCVTALGDAAATHAALIKGERGLQLAPILGSDGGESAPLALTAGRSLDETNPPNWLASIERLLTPFDGETWGGPRRPIYVTSSNFGVGSLYAFKQQADASHLAYGTPHKCVEWLGGQLGWGPNVSTVSHACVSAHLGLLLATRALHAGLADEALVFSFDFISPFVAGGFNALKILNSGYPAPYADRATGSIGLGDGAAYAVLTRDRGEFVIRGQSLYNEMHHFTANRADGTGFAACLAPLREDIKGRRVWLKGHGTGTLEAGRLESTALAEAFPDSPLVGWKGSLGHTLGSCGLVELAIAAVAIKQGRAPGTVGSAPPVFHDCVALEPFSLESTDGVVCASNAFGGAHAAFALTHD